jgi:hypothetical protein
MFTYNCELNSIDHADYILDFEINYKNNCNNVIERKSVDGFQIFAPTLDDVQGLYPKKKMYKNLVTAGSINIFDNEVTSEKKICGGEYWIYPDDVDKIHDDDYVEFAVVDKNDVLGLFSTYGLSVANGDVLELVKFVETDYIIKGDKAGGYHSRLYEGIKGTNTVYAGLFFRCIVHSHGTENFRKLWRCYYYE